MPSRARLEWNGDQLLRDVAQACRGAINETLREADRDATETHAWLARRGMKGLEGQIKVQQARIDRTNGLSLIGRFGYSRSRGFYGLFHELGTTHEFERPTLRPAADRTFPSLAARIKAKLANPDAVVVGDVQFLDQGGAE